MITSSYISVQCPALQPPTGGNSTITTNNTATLTTFKCDVGYTLKGSVTAVCQTDGTWDSAVPDCGNKIYVQKTRIWFDGN